MSNYEIKIEVKSYKVQRRCSYNFCGGFLECITVTDGNFRGFVVGKNVKIHKCSSCGKIEYLKKQYPYIKYEEIGNEYIENYGD